MKLFEQWEGHRGSRCRSVTWRTEDGRPTGERSLRVAPILVVVAIVALPVRATWTQTPGEDALWTIGNCNLDASFDIADAIMMLDFLFRGRPIVPCLPLCDVTGDSEFDISDPLAVFSFLFKGRPLVVETPLREEQCDAIDNDCDGLHEEGCPTEGVIAVDLAWDPVTHDARGRPEEPVIYRIYTGTRSGQYTDVRNVRAITEFRIHGLTPGVRYYFVVTAVDRAGNESGRSNEVTAIAGPIF